VSEPRSTGSPAPSLPSLSNSTSDTSNLHANSSRIPKYKPQKQTLPSAQEGFNSPLSERSLNDNNIPLSQRAQRRPSKLRGEISNSTRGRRLSRTLSGSSTHSTKYHTIQHKSASLSPRKGAHETPEWKRRLIHGDVAYGEQRDLFSPAGLENIFRPPPTQESSPIKSHTRNFADNSIAMPSSPPLYNLGPKQEEKAELSSEEGARGVAQERPKPPVMKYRMADDGGSDFTSNDLSRSSSFQPAKARHQESQRDDLSSDEGSNLETSILPVQPIDEGGRTVSVQSDIRNEELSPIYVSRHNTTDGQVDYAALDLSAAELQRRLEDFRESSPFPPFEEENDISQPLPVDMTAGTDDYAHNGRFVNLRRGGRSQEGSFQKRMLSSSSFSAIDESAMLPEESMQASTPKQLPNIKKIRASNEYQKPTLAQDSPPAPQTRHVSPTKSTETEQKGSSGSPLKLFGTYDTFTNQKLLRRLSQFEGDFDGNHDESAPGQESTHPELNEAFVAASSPAKVPPHQNTSRKITSFGQGDLDSFQFSEGNSYESHGSRSQDDDKENMSLPVLNPNTQTTFKFQLEPSPALEEDIITQHQTKYINTSSKTTRTISVRKTVRPGTGSSDLSAELPVSQRKENLRTPRKRDGDSEGKRLPKSPLKDPTPKRRRTLHKDDAAYAHVNAESAEYEALNETHQQMQSVIGRKRKDARHGDELQAANPKVLAMRQILRPRTPTPSQRSSQHQERPPLAELDLTALERAKLVQEQKIANIQAEMDSTDPLRASIALGMSQQLQNDSRKGSVTTQDFLDEAKKIMAGIRGKARPRSGLTSLEESESENDRNQSAEPGTQDGELEDSYQESTKEPFSRPPSRDGAPLPRLPLKQEDPALLDHLRKYQEMSDMGDVIASSMKSIAMAKKAAHAAKEVDRIAEETISRASGRLLSTEHAILSDPPNVRISENPDVLRKRKHSTSSIQADSEGHHYAEFPSQGSNASSSQSTSRSIPTGSSRGSDSRRVIAPHTVSHLIPEQLAGMVFDRERNIWVKRKTIASQDGEQNFLPSDETEDDPFGDIPDLSVDETQERQRIKAVAAKRKEDARVAQELHDEEVQERGTLEKKQEIRLDGMKPNANELPSSEASKLTGLSSSGTTPQTNTRPSSLGEDHGPTTNATLKVRNHHRESRHAELQGEVVEEVEREISILEDRVNPLSPRRRRNVTISFSSPIASVILPSTYNDDYSFERDADQHSQSDNDENEEVNNGSLIITKNSGKHNTSSTKTRTAFHSTSRSLSIRGQRFPARPVSRIDEQDEESFNRGDDRHKRSISIIVAAPTPSRRVSSMVLATPRPAHEIGTLELSPLSPFSVHQANESFSMDVSYVAQRQHYVLGTGNKRALSLSIKQLVEKITQVEPYEPFWEHMKQLELKDKGLTNLHKLDEFCEQLEELDASHNQIGQLDGVPRTVRQLKITHNCLTDLAAWGHLCNLQYIDVSNNEIESLSSFKYLIHLRGLRADNNKIDSLDGVSQLDGLLNLRLRGNAIESIDFAGTRLQRLTDLDLKDNNINKVQNLQELSSLANLNLEENRLCDFSLGRSETHSTLRHLRLSGNGLKSIDVSQYPDLRLLYLDQNRLGTVTGLLKAKHLDSLSMREQQSGTVINQSFISEAFEVRKLFLSGNFLGTFELHADFLNLQYLELANCGLESLPEQFGQMVLNTRVLNLNFNALKDLRPLVGIVRLKKLHLAGNRLTHLELTAAVLAEFPSLTLADLRCNPLTIGFYPPITETRMVVREDAKSDETGGPEPFTLGGADNDKDARYSERLDMETKMLRRVFEMMVLRNCIRMKTLDGLSVNRPQMQAKDKVWNALIEAGICSEISPSTEHEKDSEKRDVPNEPATEPPEAEKPIEEERWHAEDSFA
jgi:Leucine-rich repeat (LRR) protein